MASVVEVLEVLEVLEEFEEESPAESLISVELVLVSFPADVEVTSRVVDVEEVDDVESDDEPINGNWLGVVPRATAAVALTTTTIDTVAAVTPFKNFRTRFMTHLMGSGKLMSSVSATPR